MQQSPYAAREQARWMQPNASRWVRPDAARFLKPGTRVEDVFPALALKYNPNQPRVPAGNPDGGQWTDGEGGAGQSTDAASGAARSAKPTGNVGITDRRVVSDADPESVKPGAQYAQARGGRGRGGGPPSEMTPAQAARLEIVRSRAEEAIARVRVVDRDWKPTPSAYETTDGMIRAYEADAAQAQARLSELAAQRLAPGPFAVESLPLPSGLSRAGETRAINEFGRQYGCAHCGTTSPGGIYANFFKDHQPPTALNWSGAPQRLFPHCASCSGRQGLAVRQFLRERR